MPKGTVEPTERVEAMGKMFVAKTEQSNTCPIRLSI